METVEQFAKHFDTAFLSPALTEDEVRRQAKIALDYHVATFYTNPIWTPVVAEILGGTDVHIGAACSFPHGTTTLEMKKAEMEEAVASGATSVDLVANVAAIKEGRWDYVKSELEALRTTAGDNWAKYIIETCFLNDAQLAKTVRLCSEAGIDFAKSGTNVQGKSQDHKIRVMLDNVSGSTKVKCSALPDSFMMSAILWMIHEGVQLFGTMYATERIEEYRDYLAWSKRNGIKEW
ncbi:deoxyribose-phosphate aldolase [Olsenella profusa DSM 13989]|uniref:deoxyribose-phosphate aldolase n=1 Tax=Olsenella profusa TaxID=138595 RepID=UPI00277E72C2|nr:deoxyribose-phosphate aldolase [Olsenella profusa]MDP9859557.1 deoxyribose-phosphate aldolase [Olsenella profusa DSM 13989]